MVEGRLSPTSAVARFRAETDGANLELPYAGINTFLKRPYRSVEELGGSDFAVLGVPYDTDASNRPGARYGPRAIRSASSWWGYLSGFKEGLTNMYTGDTVDFTALDAVDCGDIPVFPGDDQTTRDAIKAYVATVSNQTAPVILGGDHSCTYPAFCGFAEGGGYDSVGLVQIDAHTDTTGDSHLFGDHYHGSSTRHIAESAYGRYDSISQIGIRGYERPKFMEFVEESGLNLFTMAEVHDRGIEPVVRDAIDAAAAQTDAVYVTFDIDAVGPYAAPGTGTPCPGGLAPHQAKRVMDILGMYDCVGAVDIMEVAPMYDPTGRTAQLAAFLLVTFLEQRFAR